MRADQSTTILLRLAPGCTNLQIATRVPSLADHFQHQRVGILRLEKHSLHTRRVGVNHAPHATKQAQLVFETSREEISEQMLQSIEVEVFPCVQRTLLQPRQPN